MLSYNTPKDVVVLVDNFLALKHVLWRHGIHSTNNIRQTDSEWKVECYGAKLKLKMIMPSNCASLVLVKVLMYSLVRENVLKYI